VKTKSGRTLTPADLEKLAAEAEAGYDLTRAKRRIVTKHVVADTNRRTRKRRTAADGELVEDAPLVKRATRGKRGRG